MKTYLTVRAKEGVIDPFAIGETIEINELKVIKTELQKNGNYLITTEDEETAEKLLCLVNIEDGTEVEVKLHQSLNGCKGVVRCPAIQRKSEVEILKHLESQAVTKVQARGNSGIYVLTFNLHQPPKEIKIGALTAKVTTFYPRPMICHQCFIYGHTAEVCRNNPACKRCGQYHNAEQCPKTVKCRNCGGEHLPTDQRCKIWKQEMAINRMMVDKNIPAARARAVYRKENKRSYIVAPKLAPEARKITVPEQCNKPNQQDYKKKPATQKRKSAPAPLAPMNIEVSSDSSSSSSEDEAPPRPPPTKKGKGKAAASRTTKEK